MKRRLYIGALALICMLCCFGLSSCGGGETADTAVTTEAQTTKAPETEPMPPKPEGFSVPVRCEKEGKLQWEYTYSPDGAKMTKTVYTEETPVTYTTAFDDKGTPLYTEWLLEINSIRSELWRDEYDELDQEGRITLERRYCEGDIQNAYAYTYDAEGRMETQTSRDVKQRNIIYRLLYDDMGTHVGTRFSKYNGENGYYHPMKSCTYDSKGRLLTVTENSYTVEHAYTETAGLVTGEKITTKSGDYSFSYYYQYTYENGLMTKAECFFEGQCIETVYYEKTDFEHYEKFEKWIHRERLP